MEMTAEEAYQARLRRSKMITQSAASDKDEGNADNKIKKMMEAMGWKGKGLGKQEQGIINPLIAKKTDSNAGFIV
jgi:splicing factor 45